MTEHPPRREPTRSFVSVAGGDIAVYDWPGEGPPLLFVHANSFHARVWDEIIRGLPEHRCCAIDMPGHGASFKWPEGTAVSWQRFGPDVVAAAEHLGLRDATAIGHSMGGFSVALAAWTRPGIFGRLLLLDPVISPPTPPEVVAERSFGTRRRRDRWESRQQMYERFRHGPPYGDWDDRILRDYVEYGLVPTAEGDLALACPPHCENAIYAGAPFADVWQYVPEIDVPVRIIRARQRRENHPEDAFAASPTAPELAGRFRNAVDVVLPGRSHFFPMESPDLVLDELRALLSESR